MNDELDAELPDDDGIERREILVRLGKLAALTPPAVVTLLVAPRAAAGSVP